MTETETESQPAAPVVDTEPIEPVMPEPPSFPLAPAIIVPAPPVAPVVAEIKNIDVDAFHVELNDPAGRYRVPKLVGQRTLELVGEVAVLEIELIDGGSTLDASGLKAKQVVFVGKVDGGSKAIVNAPGGEVFFREKVDGHSKIEIAAPAGRVQFGVPNEANADIAKIDGDSKLTIIAQSVRFHSQINGTTTEINVTHTADGQLEFLRLAGGSRILYRTPDRAPPLLKAGELVGSATVRQIE